MKTTKFTYTIVTLSLVLFMSVASIANSSTFYTGDLPKPGDKSLSISSSSDMDFSYLRFDVNKYVHENEAAEAAHSTLDYLRFDVNEFMNENETEIMDLPIANEFDYLRFDLNNFTESNANSIIELPENEFNYLRFDVNNYIKSGNNSLDELPVTV